MKEKNKEKIKKRNYLEDTLITILIMVAIIMIFVFINIYIEKQNIPDIDLTKEKLYSLSNETKQKIKDINKETNIVLYGMDMYPEVIDFTKLYNEENSNIKMQELKDVTTRPDLQKKFGLGSMVQGGVIIVETKDKNKVISSRDLYTYDYKTMEQYDITEQVITNAILDINLEKHPQVYFVTNHTENSEAYMISKELLKNEANDVKNLDLIVSGKIPEDCDVLVLTTLKEDFTEYEKNIILEYINNGRNMMILSDPPITDEKFPNFQSILDEYGASINNGIIIEENANKRVAGYTNIIIPDVNEISEVTKYISREGKVALLNAGVIDFKSSQELEALGVKKEDLLKTTNTSSKRKGDIEQNLNDEKLEKIEAEIPIASIVTKQISEDKNSKLIICANSLFISNVLINLNKQSAGGMNAQEIAINFYNNRDFMINSISYLADRKDNIVVRKDTGVATYMATEKEDLIIRIVITILPILIILVGIIVWQVRRRKK